MVAPDERAGGDDAIRRRRLLSRLASAYLLDVLAIARGEGDPLDTLIAAAIIQANVAGIRARADLQLAFAQADRPPPDELRRPVSMNAIANSLNLPFETVRRRIGALAAAGHCRFVEGGVIVPAAVLMSPAFAKDAEGYERTRAFYGQIRGLGLLGDLPPPTAEIGPGEPPVRTVWRLIGSYMLRVAEDLGQIGRLLDAVILFEVFRSNTERWPPAPLGREGTTAADLEPDRLRRPASISALARRLGMSPETVRRHVLRLSERGHLARTTAGLVIPAEVLAQPRFQGALEANAGHAQRLMSALSRLGVLQLWDRERAAGTAAA
ncbi:DeoR family transcriptional regulator [Phenylobacterium sp.]|uniref:DeoR family transcriptional regulator n=1 Tax=Phenylobacterium sp. TaxID=1871053 RepID=UPI003946A4A0